MSTTTNGSHELQTEDEALSRPARRRHRQGDVGPRPDRRGRPLLREALHALAAPALVDRGLRLHRGRPAVGRPGHVHRRGARVPAVRLLRVLPRRGAGDRRAAAVRASPRRPTRRRSSSPRRSPTRRSTWSSWTASTARCFGVERRRRSATCSTSSARRERGLGDALRRHPPRVRRATCARTRATSRALVRGITVYMIVIEGMLGLADVLGRPHDRARSATATGARRRAPRWSRRSRPRR